MRRFIIKRPHNSLTSTASTQHNENTPNTELTQHNENTPTTESTQHNENTSTTESTQHNENTPNTELTQHNENTPTTESTQNTQNTLATESTQHNENTPTTGSTQKNENTPTTGSTQNTQNTPTAESTQTNGNEPTTQQTQNSKNTPTTQNQNNNNNQNENPNAISPTLTVNIQTIQQTLGQPEDLIVRELTVGASDSKGCVVHISGITDQELVNNNVLKMIQTNTKQFDDNMLDKICQEVISITNTKKVTLLTELIDALLAGNALFLLDGERTALAIELSGGEQRSIDEPQIETAIRGSRISFVENISTNVTLIRREIKDPNLRFKMYDIGKRSKQKLTVCYIDGVVNPETLAEVMRRIETVDIDYASDLGFVEQWIEDSFLSPFPQLLDTERPDRLVSSILNGKIGILINGSPSALIAPVSFGEAIRSIEDYSQRWIIGTLLRLLRYFALFISLFLPALYVALVAYHPGMLPTKIVFSIAATREGVPFPSIIEALLMAVTFEILQEAGIRLPKAIGQTIGIVGGIVIGDVAVSAGIVSPAMVIVTSLTAIASFTLPNYSMAVGMRVMRFALIIAASWLGIYGIILVFIMMCIHLVNLKSMGVPYSAPFAPYFLGDLKDILVRAPIMALTKRPPYLRTEDEKKLDDGG